MPSGDVVTRSVQSSRLARILKDFPDEQRAEFILTVEALLAVEHAFPREPFSYRARRAQLQKISGAAAALLDALYALEAVDLRPRAVRAHRLAQVIVECGGVDELEEARKTGQLEEIHRKIDARDGAERSERGTQEDIDSEESIDEVATRAMLPVETLMILANREIKSIGRRRSGRRTADPSGTLTEVARAYRRIFNKVPTQTKDGPFFRLAVEITGQDDPGRGVKKAVAAVRMRRNSTEK